MKIVYFGSFQHYSVYILAALASTPGIEVTGVVTTPPQPAGRKQILKKTEVQLWAEAHGLAVFTPSSLEQTQGSAPTFDPQPNYFVVAGYSKIMPANWLNYPKLGSLNLHFSLLPKFRGANPAEWAILLNESETGISLIQMNEGLDKGDIITQETIQINKSDTRETLYEKLYKLGAEKLPEWLFQIENSKLKITSQSKSPTPYASRFSRDEGFIDWQIISACLEGKPFDSNLLPPLLKKAYALKPDGVAFIERAVRALSGYPGVWTIVNTTKGNKRLKIISASLQNDHLILISVQLEGLKPASFNEIKNQIKG